MRTDKKGFLLAEETLKIILAVIAIGFLAYLLVSIYFNYRENKDLEMATRLGRELHIPMFIGTMVHQLYNYAIAQGSGDDCHTAIIKFIEDWGGVRVRSKKGG